MFVTRIFAEKGGLERVWTDRMNALSEDPSYVIFLVTTDQGDHPVPYPLSKKVHHIDLKVRLTRYYSCSGFRRIFVYWQLMSKFHGRMHTLLSEVEPDILIGTTSTFTDALIRCKGNIPLVVESHGLYERPYHMEKMTLFKRIKAYFHYRTLAKADMLVSLTKADGAQWQKLCRHVCVIPNLAHLNPLSEYSTCESKKVIFVGRNDPQKGYEMLREIWALVQKRRPDWSLSIHSQTADIMAQYRQSSILIVTSVYEPFGLVMPEAMSCGVPVVAFDCPYGPSEIITDGYDGFLIKSGDVNAFVEKLILLMDDDGLRKRMGQHAVASSRRYSKERIIPLWRGLYDKLSGKN